MISKKTTLSLLCATLLLSQPSTGISEEEPSALKIVALGTSLTSRGGWPEMLGEELSACLQEPVTVKTVALAGSTTDWALGQIARVTEEKPDIVLVEFYANDAAINRWMSVSTSRSNIAAILDGLRAGAPQARIVIMAMNPVSGLRGWMRPFLSSYIDAHREEAESRGMGFVDFRPAWNAMSEADREEAIPDGLHPQPEKAGMVMAPILSRYLAGNGCKSGKTTP
ncbi:SGNH/GDSL hydrolase family protein [Rhizobium cremeum]|uniref:SGNH/GDSL hydrolase family protein n=1 Tax=Rhizobium cremeum TaxID=2813827 RepID=UPI0039DFA664